MLIRVIHRKVGTEGLLKQDLNCEEQPYILEGTQSSGAHIKERLVGLLVYNFIKIAQEDSF